jgi:aryl-alcohol dehydrogenase-like predicted oxidoreductase
LQIEYSLNERTVERELIPMAKALKFGLVAWGPLAGGVLSGKYHSGQSDEARYRNRMLEASRSGERIARLEPALARVAADVGRSMAQVALAWLRYRDIPVIPIVGARRMAQLEDNLTSLNLELTGDQVDALDEASSIEMGFPYDVYKRERIVTFVYGGVRDRILTA